MIGFSHAREKMVEEQVIRRGIRDQRVIEALLKVERHQFVESAFRPRAYNDTPLPIGNGQTISQPYMVALMTESLMIKNDHRILEIGTGSGYQAAILAQLSQSVFSVERDSVLALRARKIIDSLGYANIAIKVGDGTIGWQEFAPYNGIIVTAGAPMIPEKLLKQVKDGGRIVIPIGDIKSQRLCIYQKKGERFDYSEVCSCAFVPLVGKEGWIPETT